MSVNGMEITDVVVYPLKNKVPNSKLSAFARVVFNDQFIIHGVRVIEGLNGPFIAFPMDPRSDTEQSQNLSAVCHPITAELRYYISEHVLVEYAIQKKK